jgi:hypothetical protein
VGVLHKPHFGFTRHGHPVHASTADYHPSDTRYQRFNKNLAVNVTRRVGTMTCAYVFSVIALASLPAILTNAFHMHFFPAWLVSAGLITLVSWVAQTYIQLVLLSVIMVGQDVSSKASDARAAKTFEDTERIMDSLNLQTDGGLTNIEQHLAKQDETLARLCETKGNRRH